MDIKDKIQDKIEEIAKKIKENPELLKKFKTDAVGAVEEVLEIDLPNDEIEKIVMGLKAKFALDEVSDGIEEAGNTIGKAIGGFLKNFK